jgi:hypothetical protein
MQKYIFSVADMVGNRVYDQMLHPSMKIYDYERGDLLLPHQLPFLQRGHPNAATFWTQHPGAGGVQWLFNLAAVYDYYIGPNKWFVFSSDKRYDPKAGKVREMGTFTQFFPLTRDMEPLYIERMKDFSNYKEFLHAGREALIKEEADKKLAAEQQEAAKKAAVAAENAVAAAAIKAARNATAAQNAAVGEASRLKHADLIAANLQYEAHLKDIEALHPWKMGRVLHHGHPEVRCECSWGVPECYCFDIGTRFPIVYVEQVARPVTPSGYSTLALKLNMEYIRALPRVMLDYAIYHFNAALGCSTVDGKEVLSDWLYAFPIEDFTSTLSVTLPERLEGLRGHSGEDESFDEKEVPDLIEIYELYLRPYGFELQRFDDDDEKLRVWFSAETYVLKLLETVDSFVSALGFETLPNEPDALRRFRMQEDPSRNPLYIMLSPSELDRAATVTAVKLPPLPPLPPSLLPSLLPSLPPPRGGVRISPARAAPARATPAALPATMAARLALLHASDGDCASPPACGAGLPPPACGAGLPPPPASGAGLPPPPACGVGRAPACDVLTYDEIKNLPGYLAHMMCHYGNACRGGCNHLHRAHLADIVNRETGLSPTPRAVRIAVRPCIVTVRMDDGTSETRSIEVSGLDWTIWSIKRSAVNSFPLLPK